MGGMMTENGPLYIDGSDHTKLYYNNNTWTKQVNMLWLEAPAGVGFSYSRTPSDYNTNDTVTADDNFQALLLFFKGFSEFASNDFFIAGESYAG